MNYIRILGIFKLQRLIELTTEGWRYRASRTTEEKISYLILHVFCTVQVDAVVESMFQAIQEACTEPTSTPAAGGGVRVVADVEARLEQLACFLERLAHTHPLLLLRRVG